ncbi:FxsA family protein [Risungbinella massiliensis]|uniref:FxsA family protein n=1 Tax=Risungbinella massiliensis TaxID=1329796 RepID=UPI0005CBD24D|nr:FxsA family protein [Risungbinella massiliensis]
MTRLIFILLLTIPLIELFGLITVGSWIGALPTISLCILTALIGTYLAKREGLRAYRSVMEQFRSGQVPGYTVVEGLAILLSGLFLMFPGFFSDIIGLLLLLPWSRRLLVDCLIQYGTKKMTETMTNATTSKRIYIQNHAE